MERLGSARTRISFLVSHCLRQGDPRDSHLFGIPNSSRVIDVVSDPLPNIIDRIGFRHHDTAIDLGWLSSLERLVQACAAQHDQATFYVWFDVLQMLAVQKVSAYLTTSNIEIERCDALFCISTYFLTFILASRAPCLSGRMTIHSCLPMVTRVVVNGRLAIPCAAILRNELNIWCLVSLNDT